MAESRDYVMWLCEHWPGIWLLSFLLLPAMIGLWDVIHIGICVVVGLCGAVVNASMSGVGLSLAGALALYIANVMWKLLCAIMTSVSVGIGMILLTVIGAV